MNKHDILFLLCLTGTVLLAAGVVFLPRHFSRSLDLRDLNHVEVSKRDDFSFLEQSSDDVLDAVWAFRSIKEGGENLTLISSIEEPIQISTELLDQVLDQVRSASDCGMFEWIEYMSRSMGFLDDTFEMTSLSYDYWIQYAKYARYYSLTYESRDNPNRKEMLNFWYLRFSDNQNFDYSFIVNAVTYQIYYAEIHNPGTELTAAILGLLSDNQMKLYENTDSHRIKTSSGTSMTVYDASDDTSVLMEECGYISAAACGSYYRANTVEYVGYKNLFEKLSVIILSYDSGTVYIQQEIAEDSDYVEHRGLSIGLQEVANRMWILEGPRPGQETADAEEEIE